MAQQEEPYKAEPNIMLVSTPENASRENDKHFCSPRKPRQHEITHNNHKSFQCGDCQKLFKLESSLKRHYSQSHEQTKKHKCDKCTACFAQLINLQVHQQNLHSNRTKFPCSDCDCNFTRLNALNRHKRKQHSIDTKDFNEEDPNLLAQKVLSQLKSLEQSISLATQNTCDTNNFNKIPQHENTFIDEATIGEATIAIKLNPERIPETITLQTVKRPKKRLAYVCVYCAKEFYKTYNLIRHLRIHTKERPFICTICSKGFITKTQLKSHTERLHILDEKSGTFSNQHQCPVCLDDFKCRSIRQLEEHFKEHADTHATQYYCDVCQRSFWSRRMFSSHKHRIEDKELKMLEHLLPEPISLQTTSKSHRANNKANFLKNTICSLQQRSNQVILRRRKQHEIIKKFKCYICGCTYVSNCALRTHQKLRKCVKVFSCSFCPYRAFPTKSQLQRHNRHVHQTERNFKCVYCPKTFKSKSHCKSHMKTHLNELLKTSNSDDFDTKIKQNTSDCNNTAIKLKQHEFLIKTDITNPNLANIEIRIMPEFQKNVIQDIKEMENSSSNYHICSYCSKQFQKPSDLLRHERLHSKERPFKCQICEKSFKLKSTLKGHQRTHLNNREKIACQVCGKLFATQKSLNIHLRLHTGVMPFSCQVCEKSFRTSGHHLAHMKTNKNGNCKNSSDIKSYILNYNT